MKDFGVTILEKSSLEKKIVFSVLLKEEFMVDYGEGFFIPNDQYAVIASMVRDKFFAPNFIKNFDCDFAKNYMLWTRSYSFIFKRSIFLTEKKIKISVTLIKVGEYFFELEFIFLSDRGMVFARGYHKVVVQEKLNYDFILVTNLSNLESQDLKTFLGI
jgi:hypothetical protein